MNYRPTAKASRATIRALLSLIAPHRSLLLPAFSALLAGSALNLLLPALLRHYLEPDGIRQLQSSPFTTGAVFIAVFALQGICFYFRSRLFGLLGQRTVATLRERLYADLVRRPAAFFDENRTGDLVSRLNSDTLMVQDAVSVKLSVVARYGVQVLVGGILMVLISWKLSLALLTLLPALIAVSMLLGRKLRNASKAQQQALAGATVVAEETFSGNRTVKIFNREQYELERYGRANKETLQFGEQRTDIAAFFSSFVSFLMNAGIVLVVLYGVHLTNNGALSIADLTAFLLYGVIVAVSFTFLAGAYTELLQALGAAERVFQLCGEAQHSSPQLPVIDLPSPAEVPIQFENVTFHYPSRPAAASLSGFNLRIAPGKVTALVGPSGAGKSTVLHLLLGLYPVTSGSITLGDRRLTADDLVALREMSGFVPQDPVLFACSVAENLRYGKPDASEDELRAACARAQILDFVESLPEKFNTLLGERGIQLSGGQRQRLAIARAIIRSPDLLVLDEATSSLDSESEHLVQRALLKEFGRCTVLVVAHRLSTVRDADAVVVIDRGCIVESGNHNSLLHENGLYASLVAHQDLR